MLRAESVNHMSISVNNLERAMPFYIEMLGMRPLAGRKIANDPLAGLLGVPDTPFCRLICGGTEVTLFQRPRPIERDLVQENGKFHYSYRMEWDELTRRCSDLDGLRRAGYKIPFDPVFRNSKDERGEHSGCVSLCL